LVIYDLTEINGSGTELAADANKIGSEITKYYDALKSKTTFDEGSKSYSGFLTYWTSESPQEFGSQIFFPFSENKNFNDTQFKRMYTILSQDLKSANYQNFKNSIVGELITNPNLGGSNRNSDYGKVFDDYWEKKAKPAFEEEDRLTTTFLDKIEKDKLKDFLNFTPYPTGKVRDFDYIRNDSPSNGQKKIIRSLGAVNNSNRNKEVWNSEDDTDLYISKVKLN